MSRGPGRWQAAILHAVSCYPTGVVLTASTDTPAEQAAIRRAARTLAAAGRVLLTLDDTEDGRRLIACRPTE